VLTRCACPPPPLQGPSAEQPERDAAHAMEIHGPHERHVRAPHRRDDVVRGRMRAGGGRLNGWAVRHASSWALRAAVLGGLLAAYWQAVTSARIITSSAGSHLMLINLS
jgi:hypothetical protein